MTETSQPKFPVFVMCGRDMVRRRLLKELDPDKQYKSKALLPFLGKRLIDWQLIELKQSPFVEGIYIIGLYQKDAAFDFPVHYVPVETNADFSDKLIAGLNYLKFNNNIPELIVISSSDAPGINTESINKFFEHLTFCQGCEFVLSLVPEHIIENEFPRSGRVVLRFSDCQAIPGELYALSPRAIEIGQNIIRDFSQSRRKINRQAAKINVNPFIRYFLMKPIMWQVIAKYLSGKASISDAEDAFSKAFNCKTRGVFIDDAGFGMDMDLPGDYERLEDYVRRIKLADVSKITT